MVLLEFIGIALGGYGAYQLMKEPFQIAKEQKIQSERSDVDIETICDYMGMKKVKGVYPSHEFDNIEELLVYQFYFDENEIAIIKDKFNKLRQQQSVEYKEELQKKYHRKAQFYINEINELYKDKYISIEHWHYLSKEEHQKRINQIYQNEYWQQIALEPPRLIKNNKRQGHIEVWRVKKAYGFLRPQPIYDLVCEKLEYDNWNLREKKNKVVLVNNKPQILNNKPQILNNKPQILNNKPQILNNKPQILNNKQNIMTVLLLC